MSLLRKMLANSKFKIDRRQAKGNYCLSCNKGVAKLGWSIQKRNSPDNPRNILTSLIPCYSCRGREYAVEHNKILAMLRSNYPDHYINWYVPETNSE